MYLRFITPIRDVDSGRRQGIFHALGALHDEGKLHPHEDEAWLALYRWFSANLKEPSRFAKIRTPHAKRVALSWFKDSASEHLARMHELAAILRDHGVDVGIVRTDRPGYVVYEDEHQVVAEPFFDTQT